MEIVFALSAVLILVSSLAVVLVRNPVRATLLLILSFLPTSLVYILLQASFVGILQILVYAGAIMMLFTFVIMMINPSPREGELAGSVGAVGQGGEEPAYLRNSLISLGVLLLAGAAVIPPVYRAASQVSTAPVTKPGFGELGSIADLLFKNPKDNPLTVSFELISFLILVGIIAALNFSRRKGAGLPKGPGSSDITTRPTEALPMVARQAGSPARQGDPAGRAALEKK